MFQSFILLNKNIIMNFIGSELTLVEEVHLYESILVSSPKSIIVVNPSTLPLLLIHLIGIHSCHFHELVDMLLTHTDSIVGSDGVDVPLKVIFLWVILSQKEWVAIRLNC